MNKQEIRKEIKVLKLALTDNERKQAAHAVFAKIEGMTAFHLAQRILLYNALPDELPTYEHIKKWALRKQIFLPRVNGEELEILQYDPNNLSTGAFGIEEPQGDNIVEPNSIDLIIVPAVAFDTACNRLGRGKGFYDRLLTKTRATTIGVGYDIQLISDVIPTEPHDVKLDYVITPTFSE